MSRYKVNQTTGELEDLIAGAEEKEIDSGWKTALGNDGNSVKYRKIGDIVYVRRGMTGTVPVNTPTIIGVLPEGYRPAEVATFVLRADATTFTSFSIYADSGNISITTTANANYIPAFSVSFLAN